jgi:hypothetical protein
MIETAERVDRRSDWNLRVFAEREWVVERGTLFKSDELPRFRRVRSALNVRLAAIGAHDRQRESAPGLRYRR